MQISVRDYRGCERAEIELDSIALLAGGNEQGKTSVAEAVRSVLTGVPIVVPGVTKKDAAILVRDGQKSGAVEITDGEYRRVIKWPEAKVIENEVPEDKETPILSPFAAGLSSIVDLPITERAKILSVYIDAAPTYEEVRDACKALGYKDEAVEKIWKGVSVDWDETLKQAVTYSAKLKGQWEEVTGENYGPKKAETWFPPDQPISMNMTREELEDKLNKAGADVLEAIGDAAVSSAVRAQLEADIKAGKAATPVKVVEDQIEALKIELAQAREERRALPAVAGPDTPNPVVACPSCGTALIVEKTYDGPVLLKEYDEKQAEREAKSKDVLKKLAKADGKIERLKGEIKAAERNLRDCEHIHEAAQKAAERLSEAGGDVPDEERITELRQAEEAARARLIAFDHKTRADKLQAHIARNARLIDLLAPDGLRADKLIEGLDAFNARLAGVAINAQWPLVSISPDLECHYGTRRYWAASRSGRWRARVMLQVVMALLDGSEAVVIDDADVIVSGADRNGLFQMLEGTGLRALVCMAFSKQALVPDLEKAGLGHSYWIERGVSHGINEAPAGE